MLHRELESYISDWEQRVQEDSSLTDLALFKIWVRFEQYLASYFQLYARGGESEYGKSPRLRVVFEDEEHLNKFLKHPKDKYIDYLIKIQDLSAHLFVPNPFDAYLSDSERNTKNELKVLRDFIAHESTEARGKYERTFFNDNDPIKEPRDYLNSIKRRAQPRQTNFSHFIAYIRKHAELVADPIM